MTIKLNGNDPPLTKKNFLEQNVFLSGGIFFSADDFFPMERNILDILHWRIHPVAPMCFSRYFVKVIESVFKQETISALTGGTVSAEDAH